MATVLFTDKAATAAKASEGLRLELWDSKVAGLCLRVTDRGRKVWVYRYRALDGRQPRLTLGDFTDRQGVRWAREEAEEVRAAVRKGGDPASDRKAQKVTARTQPIRTFDDLADAYLAACEAGDWMPKGKKQSTRTRRDAGGILKRHVRPKLGALRLADITRAGVRQVLRDMKSKGIGAQTNRTQAIIRQVFAFAIAEFEGKLVAINPAIGDAVVQEKARKRILSDAELETLWKGLADPSVLRVTAADPDAADEPIHVSRARAISIQLAMLLLSRRAAIAGMMESEINAAERIWSVPPERMKNDLLHLVPLPLCAIELIAEARALAQVARAAKVEKLGNRAPNDWPLFPSSRDATRPMHPDSVTHGLASVFRALDIDGASTHDLRRTGSTALTSERCGVSGFIRSLVLSHVTGGDGGASVSREHYDANSYMAEKRRALEAWEALLLDIVGDRARPDNVRAIRTGN